jgi:branched-chain amino acid transport system substrate-binding protein
MRTNQIFSRLLSIVCLIVILAACTPTGTGAPAATSAPVDAGAPAATSAPVAQPAKCEIKMGLLLSLTGDLGDLGQGQLPAVEMATEEINAAGGPLGCKVVVVTEDDRSNAEGAVAGAKKLVFTDGAITLLGLNSTGITALLDFARTNKVPVLTHYGGTVKLDTEGGDYVFRTVLSDSFAGIGSAKFLKDMNFKTAANLYENSESPQSNAVTMQKAFEAVGGKVVANVAFNPGQSSYQAELQKVFEAKPEVVLLAAGAESGAAIMREWYRGNYGGQWLLGSDLAANEVVAQIGADVMVGQYGQTSGDDVSSPSFKRYEELWKKKTGQAAVAPWASNLYDSFILEALAIEIGGAATGEAINANMKKVTTGDVKCLSYEECVKALRGGKTITYQGVSGPLQFNKYNNVTAPWTILQAEGDHWKVFKFYSADNFKLTD